MPDAANTKPVTDPTSTLVEGLQDAWDSVDTLPPLHFTDAEALALRKALAPGTEAIAKAVRGMSAASASIPAPMSHRCETCEVKDGHALGCVENISPEDEAPTYTDDQRNDATALLAGSSFLFDEDLPAECVDAIAKALGLVRAKS